MSGAHLLRCSYVRLIFCSSNFHSWSLFIIVHKLLSSWHAITPNLQVCISVEQVAVNFSCWLKGAADPIEPPPSFFTIVSEQSLDSPIQRSSVEMPAMGLSCSSEVAPLELSSLITEGQLQLSNSNCRGSVSVGPLTLPPPVHYTTTTTTVCRPRPAGANKSLAPPNFDGRPAVDAMLMLLIVFLHFFILCIYFSSVRNWSMHSRQTIRANVTAAEFDFGRANCFRFVLLVSKSPNKAHTWNFGF